MTADDPWWDMEDVPVWDMKLTARVRPYLDGKVVEIDLPVLPKGAAAWRIYRPVRCRVHAWWAPFWFARMFPGLVTWKTETRHRFIAEIT